VIGNAERAKTALFHLMPVILKPIQNIYGSKQV